jgi:hypothetical protein
VRIAGLVFASPLCILSSLRHTSLEREERHMKVAVSDRRLSLRHDIRTALRIRLWKSATPEQRSESVNLSDCGILYASNSSLPIGTVVEVLLKMPEEITGEPTTEWLCSGHVVRVIPIDSSNGKLGVGVQFDCYQVSRKLGAETIWPVCRS